MTIDLDATAARAEQERIQHKQLQEDYERQIVQLNKANDEKQSLEQHSLLLRRAEQKLKKELRQAIGPQASAPEGYSHFVMRLS